jgi:hypothetical protein
MLNLPARQAGPLLPAESLPAGHPLGPPSILIDRLQVNS